MSVQINDSDRFTCYFAKLARNQYRREMIARRHIPFACANEDS